MSNEEQISAYLDGELNAAETERVEKLLAEDSSCRQLYDELLALRAGFESLPKHRLGQDFATSVLEQIESTQPAGGAETLAPEPPPINPSAIEAPPVEVQIAEARPCREVSSRRKFLWPVLAVAAAVLFMITNGDFLAPQLSPNESKVAQGDNATKSPRSDSESSRSSEPPSMKALEGQNETDKLSQDPHEDEATFGDDEDSNAFNYGKSDAPAVRATRRADNDRSEGKELFEIVAPEEPLAESGEGFAGKSSSEYRRSKPSSGAGGPESERLDLETPAEATQKTAVQSKGVPAKVPAVQLPSSKLDPASSTQRRITSLPAGKKSTSRPASQVPDPQIVVVQYRGREAAVAHRKLRLALNKFQLAHLEIQDPADQTKDENLRKNGDPSRRATPLTPRPSKPRPSKPSLQKPLAGKTAPANQNGKSAESLPDASVEDAADEAPESDAKPTDQLAQEEVQADDAEEEFEANDPFAELPEQVVQSPATGSSVQFERELLQPGDVVYQISGTPERCGAALEQLAKELDGFDVVSTPPLLSGLVRRRGEVEERTARGKLDASREQRQAAAPGPKWSVEPPTQQTAKPNARGGEFGGGVACKKSATKSKDSKQIEGKAKKQGKKKEDSSQPALPAEKENSTIQGAPPVTMQSEEKHHFTIIFRVAPSEQQVEINADVEQTAPAPTGPAPNGPAPTAPPVRK